MTKNDAIDYQKYKPILTYLNKEKWHKTIQKGQDA